MHFNTQNATSEHDSLLTVIDEICSISPYTEWSVKPGKQIFELVVGTRRFLIASRVSPAFRFLNDFAATNQFRYVGSDSPHLSQIVFGGDGTLQCPPPLQLHQVLTHPEWALFFISVSVPFFETLYLLRAELEVLIDNDNRLATMPHHYVTGFLCKCFSFSIENFTPFAKYHTANPMAFYLGNPLVPNPCLQTFPKKFSFLLWTGKMLDYLVNRLHCRSLSRLPLWNGYLQGIKRGCRSVPSLTIQKSLQKHYDGLSRPPLGEFDPSPRVSSMLSQIFSTTLRVADRSDELSFEPSRSAGWGIKRSEGGVREFIRSRLMSVTEPSLPHCERDSPDLVRFVDPITLCEYLIPPPPSLDLRDAVACCRLDPILDVNKTKVATILEPLKVRLVTTLDPTGATLAKPLQVALWSHLSSHSQFVATSRPISTVDFLNLLDRENKVFLPQESLDLQWVSGDFAAATDTLDIRLTKFIMEFVISHKLDLTPETDPFHVMLISVYRRVLYEQLLHYPPVRMGKGVPPFQLPPVLQQNGQLMGSILSFPILCVANLLCYWLALEEYLDRSVLITDLPVLINGDDILFRANNKLYAIWQKRLDFAGFKLSIGKNYIHRSVLMINSEMFLHRNVSGHSFEKIEYLNVGLLIGDSLCCRMKDRRTLENSLHLAPQWGFDKPVRDQYSIVLSGSVSPVRSHRRFLHYHLESIKRSTHGGLFNLFGSPYLWGLGFDPSLSNQTYFTALQRAVMSKRLLQIEDFNRKSEYSTTLNAFRPLGQHLTFVDESSLEPDSVITDFRLKKPFTMIWEPRTGVPREGDILNFSKLKVPLLTYANEPMESANFKTVGVSQRNFRKLGLNSRDFCGVSRILEFDLIPVFHIDRAPIYDGPSPCPTTPSREALKPDLIFFDNDENGLNEFGQAMEIYLMSQILTIE